MCKWNNYKCVWGELHEKYGIAPKGALKDLYKDAEEGVPEAALKGTLQVALELHLFMQLSMPKSVQNDSIECEI